MREFSDTPKRVVLLAVAVAIVVLTVGLAVVRLSGGRDAADASPPQGGEEAPTGGGEAGGADVAALLPHSEAEMQNAVAVAGDFAGVYFGGPEDRVERIAELATPEYADLLAAEDAAPLPGGEPAPGEGGARVDTEVTGIRDLAEGSATCVVRVGAAGDGRGSPREYAVSLTWADDAWRVNGVQDAALGDAGVV